MEDWNWETIFCGHYSTIVTNWPAKLSIFGEKRKIKAITPFKVIQGHFRSSRSISIESPFATS